MIANGLQVALNGALRAQDHPHLDLSFPGLLADALACAKLGIRDFHLHPRTELGAESLDPATMSRWVAGFRAALPPGSLSVSTGAWIAPLDERLGAISAWSARPDFASVNFHEDGAEEIADALIAKGVGIEAGIWHADGAARFLDYPRRPFCRRLMIELPDRGEAEVDAILEAALDILGTAVDGHDFILHGEGASAWPMLQRAVRMGVATRIGLEDTILLPDGTPARSNAALVSSALQLRAPA